MIVLKTFSLATQFFAHTPAGRISPIKRIHILLIAALSVCLLAWCGAGADEALTLPAGIPVQEPD